LIRYAFAIATNGSSTDRPAVVSIAYRSAYTGTPRKVVPGALFE
jgi:hypothetical protein